MRATVPAGIRIGAYGWVENLPRMADRILAPRPGERAAIKSQQDGYIHAPSLQQRPPAAVLRSGALTRPGETTYDVNLNSRRSRIARWLIGGVRSSAWELLGYRFERDAARRGPRPDLRVPRTFRGSGGGRTDRTTPDTAGLWERSAEAVGARNVVDGVKLVAAGDGAHRPVD